MTLHLLTRPITQSTLAFTRYCVILVDKSLEFRRQFHTFGKQKKETLKQLIIISLITLLLSPACYSQSSATTVTINKVQQPALVLQLPYSTDVAEGSILTKLKEAGYSPETTGSLFWKKNKVDGFYVFNDIVLPALNHQKLDMYFKIERLGNKKQNLSTIYLALSRGENKFISASTDEEIFSAARKFLNSFVENTANYRMELDIQEQEKVVKSAEKKLANLQEDEKNLNKKIAELQKNLETKKNDQVTQEKLIVEQKAKLEELKIKAGKVPEKEKVKKTDEQKTE
jgi:hypothetical protein